MRQPVPLDGCTTTPLGPFLQGLGVWRAVTRLLDPQAEACWRGGRLILRTSVPAGDLAMELARQFRPLPIVSPWNAGSGFAGNGKSIEAEKALALVEGSTDPRLGDLREAIGAARRVVDRGRGMGWGGKGDQLWDKDRKGSVIQLCRNMLPDAALAWVDAAVALTDDVSDSSQGSQIQPMYSRLLGTGGNFGRQDLQATYIQRALTVLSDTPSARKNAGGWMRTVLFGDESTPYLREAVGQFDPGRAGGIQSSPAEKLDDKGFANPWAFLFTIEGSLFYAGATSRRHGAVSARSRAALPFVVRPSQVGYPSKAPGENTMAEIWAPSWSRPATLAEVEHLFAEARMDWHGTPARNGLDAARAIVTGGADRGIDRFDRYAVAERLGQNPLAVHVGTVRAARRPEAELTAGLDRWMDSCGRLLNQPGDAPASIQTGITAVQEQTYRASVDDAAALEDLLVAVGRLHRQVSRSGAAREIVPPARLPSPQAWIAALKNAGADLGPLRLAAALASGADTGPGSGRPTPAQRSPLRHMLTPIRETPRLEWSDRPALISDSDILVALADVHRRRAFARLPEPPSVAGRVKPAVAGTRTAFRRAVPVALADANRFLSADRAFAARVADLLHALMLFTWDDRARTDATRHLAPAWAQPPEQPSGQPADQPPGEPDELDDDPEDETDETDDWPAGERTALAGEWAEVAATPRLYALLAPFYRQSPYQIIWRPDHGEQHVLLRPDPSWITQLAAGHLGQVAADAARRLRIAGAHGVIDPAVAAQAATAPGYGQRLAAALLLPLPSATYRRLLCSVTGATVPIGPRRASTSPTDPTPVLSQKE